MGSPILLTATAVPEATIRQLVFFIFPTMFGWLSSEIMSVVDTAVVGSSSVTELAALGPATMLVDSTAYLFFWCRPCLPVPCLKAILRCDVL